MKYENYLLNDFLTDEYFLQWVQEGDKEADLFWRNWLARNPEKTEMIEEAKRIISLMNFKHEGISGFQVESLLERIHQNIEEKEIGEMSSFDLRSEKVRKEAFSLKGFALKVAAGFLIALFFSGLYFTIKNINPDFVEYTTNHTETKFIQLPDNSTVTLNANSSLKLHTDWDITKAREVWVTGEAFFSVSHKSNNQKFIVHSRELDVEVLGTKFSVNNRLGTNKVILNTGKVKLTHTKEDESIIMVPGELVEFQVDKKDFKRQKVNAEKYTSWRNKKLVFSSTSLFKIAKTLEETYGYEVVFANENLKNKKFTGTINIRDIDVLLSSIAETFNLKVIKDGNEILIKNK